MSREHKPGCPQSPISGCLTRDPDSYGQKTWDPVGVAVGSASSGVSTRTVLDPLGTRSPVPVHLHLSHGKRAFILLGADPLPLCFQPPGAIPPVMSYFVAFVTDSSPLPRPGGGWVEVLLGGLGCTGDHSCRALSNPLMRLWRSWILLQDHPKSLGCLLWGNDPHHITLRLRRSPLSRMLEKLQPVNGLLHSLGLTIKGVYSWILFFDPVTFWKWLGHARQGADGKPG